ncbi:hypothetical protein EVAR_49789_1 [Eumeta japonica]|uniref:Uncharacterized protein n=1 Tax=Eumeta variegata TaxID=151549 RepID=A0A4C1Y4E8_EUMVA|nr:hypothetical protein EVAR_49789_1 [Eumeta japonica]
MSHNFPPAVRGMSSLRSSMRRHEIARSESASTTLRGGSADRATPARSSPVIGAAQHLISEAIQLKGPSRGDSRPVHLYSNVRDCTQTIFHFGRTAPACA